MCVCVYYIVSSTKIETVSFFRGPGVKFPLSFPEKGPPDRNQSE